MSKASTKVLRLSRGNRKARRQALVKIVRDNPNSSYDLIRELFGLSFPSQANVGTNLISWAKKQAKKKKSAEKPVAKPELPALPTLEEAISTLQRRMELDGISKLRVDLDAGIVDFLPVSRWQVRAL